MKMDMLCMPSGVAFIISFPPFRIPAVPRGLSICGRAGGCFTVNTVNTYTIYIVYRGYISTNMSVALSMRIATCRMATENFFNLKIFVVVLLLELKDAKMLSMRR